MHLFSGEPMHLLAGVDRNRPATGSRSKESAHARDHLLPLNLNPRIVFRTVTCREAADRDDRIKFRIFQAIKTARRALTCATGNGVNVSNRFRVA